MDEDQKVTKSPMKLSVVKKNLKTNRLIELSKPKKTKLKATLDGYRTLMSRERQKRIECELGLTDKLPEPKGKIPRKSPEEQIKDAVELLEKIEKKIADDLLDEVLSELSKKLPKWIMNRQEPMSVTSNFQKLQYTACHLILDVCGQPKSQQDVENYRKFSGLIADFIMTTMMQSMDPITVCRVKKPKTLKSVKKNQELIKIAEYLMKRIAKHSNLPQKLDTEKEASKEVNQNATDSVA